MLFRSEENNMQIYDTELLQVNLVDPQIAALLGDAQKESITQVVQLARAKRNLQTIKQTEGYRREEKNAQDETRSEERRVGKECRDGVAGAKVQRENKDNRAR